MVDRLERLLNLVIALRETRVAMTAAEISERVAGYGQSDPQTFRRMFERDKADLRDLGVPLETMPVDAWDGRSTAAVAGYRIDPRHYDLPELVLSPQELAALALALEATGLAEEAGLGLRKLQVGAGDPEPPPASTRVGIPLDAPHRQALADAQLRRVVVRFGYRPLGRDAGIRTVDPYGLVHRRGRWYLVGRDHDRDARRAFRLDRIDGEVELVGAPGAFPPPLEDVGLDDVVPTPPPGAPETAQVSASPAIAWHVARRARGGGVPAEDGRTRFTVSVGDPEDFLFWALEYGPDLVVVAPAELRQAMVDRLERLLS